MKVRVMKRERKRRLIKDMHVALEEYKKVLVSTKA